MSKISVVIPVYNVEAYLEQCIFSVLQQTYRKFELILVDDGSTDKSGLICDQFARQNPENILVIHRSNHGPLASRIFGINYSHGDIIVFLDADDCLRKDALEQLAECFQAKECDMVLFDAGLCPDYSSRPITHPLEHGCIFEKETKQMLYQKLVTYQIPNSVCLKAIKKDRTELPEHFSQFIDVKHGEDLLMSAHLITNCHRIVYLKEGLYYYRDRPGSAVHSFDPKRKESIKVVHTELEKCIDAWGMPDLKPLHNARKVKGWLDNLILLYKNRSQMDWNIYRIQFSSMVNDPYFRSAYVNMDQAYLSLKYRLLAWLVYYVIH